MAVGDAFLGEVGVDRGGADTDQHGEGMDVQALGGADVEAGEGAQRGVHEMGVHAAGSQDHRDGDARGGGRLVGQDDVGAAGAHAFLGFAANAFQGSTQARLALGGREGAVDDAGVGAHGFAHGGEFSGGENWRFQLQQIKLTAVLVHDVAEVAKPGFQRHHPGFAQAVDRRIGDLGKALAEIVVQAAVFLGQHGERRVVAHAADGFLAVLHHGVKDHFEFFQRGADRELAAAQFLAVEEF